MLCKFKFTIFVFILYFGVLNKFEILELLASVIHVGDEFKMKFWSTPIDNAVKLNNKNIVCDVSIPYEPPSGCGR